MFKSIELEIIIETLNGFAISAKIRKRVEKLLGHCLSQLHTEVTPPFSHKQI